MEVPALKWNARTLTLSGQVARPKGETGNLFFIMPSGYRLINHEGCALAKDARDLSVIIRKSVAFTHPIMPFKLRFKPLRLDIKNSAF